MAYMFHKLRPHFDLFIYFWLRWVFIAARGLSLVAASRGYSLLQYTGFSLDGFSCCGAWALGARASVAVACGLSSCGSRALACRFSSCDAGLSCSVACGISRTRARTRVPCIGRRILNYCATRGAARPHI